MTNWAPPEQQPPPTVQHSAFVTRPPSDRKRNAIVVVGVLSLTALYIYADESGLIDKVWCEFLEQQPDCTAPLPRP